jgi:hypothetical protein
MRQLMILLAIIFLAHGLTANAATYYIDQMGGSDRNNGTSPKTAWKNCPGMTSYTGSGTLYPGDTVYFDSTDTWLVTGTQGLNLVGGVTYIGDSWGAGARAEIKANADLEAGVIRFRDHARYATLFKGFNVNANSKVTTGIDINHRYCQLMNGATKRVENCQVHHTWSRQASGQFKYGIIVSNHGGTGCYVENVEIINCIVHDTSRDALCLYPGDKNANCRIKNITVRGCQVYNTGQDPDYGAGAGLVVKGYVVNAYLENNYVHDTKGAGIFVNGNETNHYGVGPTNIHLRYNILSTPTTHGGIRIYDAGADPKDIKIYGNIILNNTANGGLSLASNSGTLNLLVYNNTFYNSFVRFTNHTSVVNTLDFINNIIHCTSAVPLVADGGIIKQHLDNIYFRGSQTLVTIGRANYTASNLNSYEASAYSGNPLFKNPGNLPSGFRGTYGVNMAPDNDGLSLQQSSYGMNRGVPLGSPYNSSINAATRPANTRWDIGAYQFVLVQ